LGKGKIPNLSPFPFTLSPFPFTLSPFPFTLSPFPSFPLPFCCSRLLEEVGVLSRQYPLKIAGY
jgi:hypothetical protein